jgi:sulfur-oxidizing protein SoxZ
MTARIQVPAQARRGEVIQVRILVQHPMETGYRYDDVGKPIPRNTIRTLSCRYNGEEILRVDMSSGIAANPYLQFFTRAEASGELEIEWIDDEGVKGSARQAVNVVA